MITPIYAALLGLMLVVLVLRVVRLRWVTRTGLGDGGHPELVRAIRVHGNFVETVPFALILMFLLEQGGVGVVWLHLYGAALIAARLLHAFGLSKSGKTSPGRLFGMCLTLLVLLAGSVGCLWLGLR